MSEEDIFGNPELMPKLSAALKTITKRKRVKGKPLVDLIATVQRDGTLPACVQSSCGSSSSSVAAAAAATAPPSTSTSSASAPASSSNRGRSRRHPRPPALVDAIATSNEEYTAKMEQAYSSSVHNGGGPGSAASAATSVSPALSNIGGNTSSSTEEYVRHGWGHNTSGYGSSQQYRRQGTPANARSLTGAMTGNVERSSSVPRTGGCDLYPQEHGLDSPTSSCTTLVAGTSPGGSGRFSPRRSLSPPPAGGRMSVHGIQLPSSAPSTGSGHHWGQHHASPAGGLERQRPRPQKRLSTTSSVASTDVESLDTSHLLEFDDDDEDESGPYGGEAYTAGGNITYGYSSSAAGGANGGGLPVSPEDLQELEDALLMDNFEGVLEELLEDDETVPNPTLPEMNRTSSFPDLYTVGESLPPLPRLGHVVVGSGGVQRSTSGPNFAGSGSNSPQMLAPPMFGISPSHQVASPGSTAVAATAGFPLSGSNSGPPRPGPRGIGRPRSQVPPRPYTPGKSSRGLPVPWLSHGLRCEVSPRIGSSPRPPTPGTPHATTPAGGRMAPSPNGRRRGNEAFPEHFGLQSPKEHGANMMGGPSPKARRVGASRAFPERFPSPQAGLSPRVPFSQHSPRSGGGAAGGGSERTYFPASAGNAVALATSSSPANASRRGHRRASSSSWGSAHRHGGGGEGSVETAAPACGFHVSTSTGQNWNLPPGENNAKSNNGLAAASTLSTRHGWGFMPGEMQQNPPPRAPSPYESTSTTSNSKKTLHKVTATVGSGRGTTLQHSTSIELRGGARAHRHGVVRRRHSAPIEPLLEPSVGPVEGTGDNSIGSEVRLKTELSATQQEAGGNGSSSSNAGIDNFPTIFSGPGGWGSPSPPPPSPMLEKDGAGAWWAQAASGVGGSLQDASAAAVAAVTAAAVPRNDMPSTTSFDEGGYGLNAQGTTVDL